MLSVKALVAWASLLSGYPVPQNVEPPALQLVSPAMMQLIACAPIIDANPGEWIVCPEYAGLFTAEGEIFIANDMKAADTESTIVHELTHWLQRQYIGNGYNVSCKQHQLREDQAYHVETLFIQMAQRRDMVLKSPDFGCGK